MTWISISIINDMMIPTVVNTWVEDALKERFSLRSTNGKKIRFCWCREHKCKILKITEGVFKNRKKILIIVILKTRYLRNSIRELSRQQSMKKRIYISLRNLFDYLWNYSVNASLGDIFDVCKTLNPWKLLLDWSN